MMNRGDEELDALFRAGRAETPPRRWSEQRAIFRRLRLGGAMSLLVARLAHASGAPMFPRVVAGTAGLGMIVTAGVLALNAVPSAPRAAPSSAVVVAPPSATVVEPPRVEAEATLPAIAIDALPSAPAPARAATSPAPREDALSRELASVSRIRAKLAAGDFVGAEEAARTHRSTFPHGVLDQEISVIEIDALAGLHDDARVCSAGRAFLEAHATSAHRDRVVALMRACRP